MLTEAKDVVLGIIKMIKMLGVAMLFAIATHALGIAIDYFLKSKREEKTKAPIEWK